MKLALKTLVPLLAVAALATACNPFTHGNSRSNGLQDPRFAPFTYTSDRKAKVQTRLDSFNERWPGMQATDGNVVAARTHSGFLHALDQDPEYWLTGVATVPTTTIDTLMEGATEDASVLPGIDPRLHKYVPENCHFSTINPDHANAVLPPEKGKGNPDFRTLPISAIAVSKDCQLLVLTAIGHP
ncbi:MAG: hypothetical protein KH051_03370 [Actinomyces sp.]|jgi:lipoprotein|uniref:hypothetical protein n=1 Tax=Schaalia sp. ORNL0103 TaxID=2789426 RepID=UPI001CA54F0E|nr:hypothetical protein [Schaalia sp. ORNL0103]MBS7159719.1 hypothetical protein [Actinomyces sp.]MBW6412310.1 hypothetical protein [Schaalia sp. ORNL0103]